MGPIEELAGYPKFGLNIDSGQSTAQRGFRVAGADVNTFINACFGYFDIYNTFFEATVPFPGIPLLFAHNANIEPFLGENDAPQAQTFASIASGANIYPFWRIIIDYKPRQVGQLSGPTGTFVEVSGDVGAEMLTIPGSRLKWNTSGKLLPDTKTLGKRIGLGNFSVKWSRVPSPPWNAIATTAGKVNQSAFNNYAQDCVIFDGAKYSSSFQISGPALWNLEYQFKGRAISWLKDYDPDQSAYDKVIDANGSGDPLLEEGDFGPLFQFG